MSWRSCMQVTLCASALTLGACAAAPRPVPGPASSDQALTGIWAGSFQTRLVGGLGAGDMRLERQAWRLAEAGNAIAGFYVAELTMLSGDGRPYRCSGKPRFTTKVRVDLRGRRVGKEIELEEVGQPVAEGQCRPSFERLARYRVRMDGDVMNVNDGARELPLRRQDGAREPAELLAFTPEAAEPAAPPAPQPAALSSEVPTGAAAKVAGLWVWEQRGVLPTGDEKIEREEWHLVQDGNTVSGYYDRAIRQVSTDGQPFRCNRALDFQVLTRYQVAGEVRGSTLVLTERAFEILEASPCDDGQRRLDSYRGIAEGGELRLLWGAGAQVLLRARPNVPSQRF